VVVAYPEKIFCALREQSPGNVRLRIRLEPGDLLENAQVQNGAKDESQKVDIMKTAKHKNVTVYSHHSRNFRQPAFRKIAVAFI